MQIQSTLELLAGILGMKEAILRQGQSSSRNSPHVCVTNQRQDRVVERRSRDFDSSLLGGLGMGGQHFAQQRTLLTNHQRLIFDRESATFLDQRSDVGVFEKEFIKPRDLRENLQIRDVLCLKVFFGSLGRIARTAKTLPKLMVSRIAANHVERIRLKQILQSEAAFARSQI